MEQVNNPKQSGWKHKSGKKQSSDNRNTKSILLGQSITLSHISPFVDVSRKKYIKEAEEDCKENGIELTEEQLSNIVERKVKKEIKDGIQTLQYQFLTLSTTNGRFLPF